jgi:hypothetical protein
MSVIQLYSIPQVIELTTGVGGTLMNYPVNRCDFNLYRYVDNQIDILVTDVDRQPVSFANATATLNLLDFRHQRLILSRALQIIDAANGQLRFTLSATESGNLPSKTLKYSVVMNNPNGSTTMLFTDRSLKAAGQINVLDGPIPEPIDPVVIEFSDFLSRNSFYYSSSYAGAAMVDNPTGIHSAVMDLTGFSGTITVQGSVELSPPTDDSLWFPITSKVCSNQTGSVYIPFQGELMWVRFQVSVVSGTLNQITYRN